MATDQETTSVGRRRCPSCGLELASSVTICPRDGTQVRTTINVDPAFTNYEFVESIGEGGMGVIYKARHRHLNKIVAIKTLHSHLTNPELIRRFQIEGKAASILSHPNIIGVQDFGLTQTGQPYMIMDYVSGQTLADALRKFGLVPMEQFIPLFLQVCDALSHAHKRAVLHRDVKPSNIMLTPNQRNGFDVRIMDFGIAKLMNESEGAQNLTKTGDAIGSPIYMSPEQARGGKMDHRSDLYSLGCVMYECLTNSPPFCGNTALDTMMMHIDTKPMPLSQASMGLVVDPRLELIVMRLLEKDPADRYQTMDEVREDLIALQNPDKTSVLPSVKESQISTQIQKAQAAKTQKRKLKEKAPLIGIISGIVILTLSSLAFLLWGSPLLDTRTNHRKHVDSGSTNEGATTSDAVNTTKESKLPTEEPKHGDNKKVALEKSEEEEPEETSPLPDIGTVKNILKNQVEKNSPKIVLPHMIGGALKDDDLKILKQATLASTIGLSEFPISDAGLDNLKDLKHVEMLDISSTKAQTLRYLANLKGLKFLYATHLKLLPEAYEVIGKLNNLTELNISFTPVTDADLQKLYNLHELRLFGIEKCENLTNLGIDRFRNALPECEIKQGLIEDKKLTAQSIMQKARAAFAAGDYTEANNKVSDALRIANARSPEAKVLADADLLKADCEVHFKLWKSAEFFYNLAIKAVYRNDGEDPKLPGIYDKLASCFEMSKADGSLQEALNTRGKAEELFQRTQDLMPVLAVDREAWKKLRQNNLEMMAKDNIATHNNKKAQIILQTLIQNSLDESAKQKYTRMLSSLNRH